MAASGPTSEPVIIDGRQYRAVREGLASILAPYRPVNEPSPQQTQQQQQKKRSHNNDEGDQAVFYNPIQQYNRDLSVLAILTYGEATLTVKREKRQKKGRGNRRKAKAKEARAQDLDAASRKRKADELTDEATNDDQSGIKRAKVIADNGNDETLEVEELPEPRIKDATVLGATAEAEEPSADQKLEKKTPFTILDALSASGLRAIRYAKEIPFVTNVVANDLSPEAVKSIELNIDHNEVRGKVHSNVDDARAYMYSKVGNESTHPSEGYIHRFDVIDLDPYGTAAPFLDSAVQALLDGGLLCVTCTDAGVFASNGYPEKAYALYGGLQMKGFHSHEAGLRLILHAVATSAAKYGIAIEPLLSLSIDFYARLFIRVHKRPQDVKLLAGTTMLTYNCDYGCGSWRTQLVVRNHSKADRAGNEMFKHTFATAPTSAQHCDHCGYKMHLGGPMWAGPIHNPHFIQRILDKLPEVDTSIYGTTDRIKGMLTLALEEDLTQMSATTEQEMSASSKVSQSGDARTDATKAIPRVPPQLLDNSPFFFSPNAAARVLHAPTPPEDDIRGALRSLGYRVTRSHCKPGSLKTNASWDVLWEIMREWIRQKSSIKDGVLKEGMAGWRIMGKARNTERRLIEDILEEINNGAGKAADKEQLKRCLEAGLYRLQQHQAANGSAEKDAAPTNSTTHISEKSASARPKSPPPPDPSKLDIVFDSKLGRDQPRGKLVRYQENPRAHWGPMSRAG